ncbi:Uncharacterised protein [Delftia tsuruhatensis]|uniref:SWIM zinc finger family protein n=1 Tax=Delftia tsuruhatensis TaxID=180282 RepID=UPI001E8016BF|nr:SWIM zinc finger family protein [Delftia tsuruhatensis]CAB5681979.1 Uncharacterised protein [Delftia tsuruhatensis]CAC9675740.1 Uncharacterised protein [Delftia tsuruhatensis]
MEFRYQYYGSTQVDDTATAQSFSFAPDLLRPPTRFDGLLRRDGPAWQQVREGLSALHSVVVSDMRTRGRDKTAYREWLQEHESQLLAGFMADTGGAQARAREVSAELKRLRETREQVLTPFYQAQRKYFDWLFVANRDAWYVLDPVITVHPDRLLFEAFSQDESSYCAVSIRHEAFEHAGERICGTTNIDYSASLYEEFQKIRNYKDTRLTLDPAGFGVQTQGDPALREEKIALPDSWLRGFVQVSSAMALPATVLELHPMDLFNLCARLRARRERHGPRALRFELVPGQAPAMVFEPWEERLVTKRSQIVGDGPGAAQAQTIRLWGRRRLLTLERLIPQATRVRVHLLGSGMPSFWVIELGLVTVTLGLSGWSANDWAASARFHLMAPQAEVRPSEVEAVGRQLQSCWQAGAQDLAQATGLATAQVQAAMLRWMQAGRAVYDLDAGRYAWRELLREPLTAQQLAPDRPEEYKALALVRGRRIDAPRIDRQDGFSRITGKIPRADGQRLFDTQLELDADERLTDARCGCNHYQQHRLRQGPCEHMIALRLVAQAQLDAARQQRTSGQGEIA